MEKKESTAPSPLGICEKLFNSFSPAFQPLRRLAFRQREPEGPPHRSLDLRPPQAPPTSVKPRPPAPEKKPDEAIAPRCEPHHPPPKPATPTPPPSAPVQKVPEKVAPRPAPARPPPKTVAIPEPAPPKAPPRGVAPPQPLPQPVPPAGAAAAAVTKDQRRILMRSPRINRSKAQSFRSGPLWGWKGSELSEGVGT